MPKVTFTFRIAFFERSIDLIFKCVCAHKILSCKKDKLFFAPSKIVYNTEGSQI